MPKIISTAQHGYVFGLDGASFKELCAEVENRKCLERLGFSSFDELAMHYGRIPKCPSCGNEGVCRDGTDSSGSQRYRCSCGRRFGLLTNSVLASAKTTLAQWLSMVSLMSYNVPLDLIAEQVGIHHNTALLMRRKLFETVNGWQEKVRLSGTVFIDEVYTFDSDKPKNHYGSNQRGLNKNKRCIFLAIDQYKNMVAFLVGSGMPTSKRINDALLPHLANGNVTKIVHDGLRAHHRAIKSAGVKDEIHKSIVRDEETLRAMVLVNSFSSWIKRYLSRFIGMDTSYLQDYLNWFVYLFRCKKQSETWPRDERIIRHLLLSDAVITRRQVPEKRKNPQCFRGKLGKKSKQILVK